MLSRGRSHLPILSAFASPVSHQSRRTISIKSLLSSSPIPPPPVSSNERTILQGWIRSCRRQKNISFAVINDGSNVAGIQAVLSKGLDIGITVGCSARFEGVLVDSKGTGQAKEFRVDAVTILGESDAETYPIANTKQGLPPAFLRKNAHLRARTKATAAMLRIRSEMAWSCHSYFRDEGFIQVQTPLITSSDCEGAGEVFRVESGAIIPNDSTKSVSPPPPPIPRYLTVSSQLHLEAIAASLPQVYTLSPAFRAEKSDTARHLQEFWMLEAEMGFLPEGDAVGLEQVMSVTEGVVKRVISHALEITAEEIGYFEEQTEGLRSELRRSADSTSPFPRMSYTDAIVALEAHSQLNPTAFAFKPSWGVSLQTEHEKWIAEELVRGPVFVTDYPSALKPFYMLPDSTSIVGRETVACFDLLVPRLGELAGGSMREHRLTPLIQTMKQHGLLTTTTATGSNEVEGIDSNYGWYLDLRKYGTTRHGGFGLGWERLVAYITGLNNVRDCIAFPRAAEGSQF